MHFLSPSLKVFVFLCLVAENTKMWRKSEHVLKPHDEQKIKLTNNLVLSIKWHMVQVIDFTLMRANTCDNVILVSCYINFF